MYINNLCPRFIFKITCFLFLGVCFAEGFEGAPYKCQIITNSSDCAEQETKSLFAERRIAENGGALFVYSRGNDRMYRVASEIYQELDVWMYSLSGYFRPGDPKKARDTADRVYMCISEAKPAGYTDSIFIETSDITPGGFMKIMDWWTKLTCSPDMKKQAVERAQKHSMMDKAEVLRAITSINQSTVISEIDDVHGLPGVFGVTFESKEGMYSLAVKVSQRKVKCVGLGRVHRDIF